MNASVNQNSRDRLTADQRANEPSMEEILASIRRIISDGDTRSAPQPRIVEKRSEAVLPMPRVQDVQNSDERSLPEARSFYPEKMIPPLGISQRTAVEVVRENPSSYHDQTLSQLRGTDHAETLPEQAPATSGLLSNTANKAVSDSFEALAAAQSILVSKNMDDMVGSLLKPMLQQWLNDHLPALVEKLVRAEIERVSRGVK